MIVAREEGLVGEEEEEEEEEQEEGEEEGEEGEEGEQGRDITIHPVPQQTHADAAREKQQSRGCTSLLWEGQPGIGDGGKHMPRCQKAAYTFTPSNGCSAPQLRRHLLGRLSNRARTHQTQKSMDLDL